MELIELDPLTYDKLADCLQMDDIAIACLLSLEIIFLFLYKTLVSFKTHTE